MATWNSRGLRGSVLEDLINMTIEKYKDSKMALIQKIPTPIKPIQIDSKNHHITLAYFEQKSTVDYIGVVQGIPLCFDAKECSKDSFSMQNIHDHQYEFMRDFEKQNGIAFILLHYSHLDETYYIPFSDIEKFYLRSKENIKKSFRYEEINKAYLVNTKGLVPLHFLEQINMDLSNRH